MFLKLKSKDSGKTYLVGQTKDGWRCTCPHFVFRLSKRGTACKHIDQAKKIIEELENTTDNVIDMTIPMNQVLKELQEKLTG